MSTNTLTRTLAPGARVEIRDEEWVVRSCKGTSDGGYALRVVGAQGLVQGREAIFLTALDSVKELRPEETALVHDDSPQYRRSRLYLDALLRRSPATDDALYVGHRAAIEPTQYQLQPAAKALQQLRPRILMADAVGLGKTIEVGVLLTELIQRGRGDRILVVALKSILSQFQKELWARFTIPLVRLDSVGIQRVQSRIPSNMNPFYYFDRVIISIDTLKKDAKYRRYLEQSHWDVVVVDECQHVALRGTTSQRARLAQLLGRTSDALILTSATPHDGRPESFASLMNLLEPTAIADPESYTSEEVSDLYLRRFKKDVAHEVRESFPEREITLKKEAASPAEEAVFDFLADLEFKTIARSRGGKGVLFRTLLLKAFLSSPPACISTVRNRLRHKDMQDLADPAVRHDHDALVELGDRCEKVGTLGFTKLSRLVKDLKALGFDRPDNKDRIVIFSERIDTLAFLEDQLTRTLHLKKNQIQQFHGTLKDVDQADLVESFGADSSPVRVLLASDAAAEGINLHYACHRMVHFDLPWSLITLEQRNGRIDRFGQTKTPEITYLLTVPTGGKLKGDLRVLERLIEKEDAVHKNLGDASSLMGLHDADLEEDAIGRGIEEQEDPEDVVPDEPRAVDFMTLLLGNAGQDVAVREQHPPRLLPDELSYAREAFKEVLGKGDGHLRWEDHLKGFLLTPPDDLLRRFDYLPPELLRGTHEVRLTVDRGRVMASLEQARQDEQKWPEWQLFWEQHPVAEWLDDRVLGKFGRHEAPALRVAKGLQSHEAVVLFQGVISNRRGQPAIVDWFGVRFTGTEPAGTVGLAELTAATALDQVLPNPGGGLSAQAASRLQALLPGAVAAAKEHMASLRKARASGLSEPLKKGLGTLTRWKDRRLAELAAREQKILLERGQLRKDQRKRLDNERHEVGRLHQARRDWIEGMRTEDEPYLRVAAVLVPQEVK